MAKTFEEWTVLPHGKLSRVDENMLTVVGDVHMPLGDFPRRMTVVRLADARLIIYSALALHEDEMQALEKFGTPSFLIVPNDIHRMDAKVWKERYPAMTVLAPNGAAKKVDEVVSVDAVTANFGDDSVRFVTVPGTDEHECALVIANPAGISLVVNDLIWNVDNRPGFGGWVFKVLGMTGTEPKIPTLVELRAVKDKGALHDQLIAWSNMPNLLRILLSHGAIVEREPSAVLRRLAQDLVE